jgi:hypothetical protein
MPNATVAVRERGIIMQAESVLATLDGRKTQTRRIVKLKPWMARDAMTRDAAWADPGIGAGGYLKVPRGQDNTAHRLYCPYGAVGDRLWVRETAWFDREMMPLLGYLRCFFEGGDVRHEGDPTTAKAPGLPGSHVASVFNLNTALVRRSSIFMPRWASRLTLQITGLRVERLQAISDADTLAEGVRSHTTSDDTATGAASRRQVYRNLWDSLNAKRGYGWDANPWVWVIGYRRLTGEVA